MEPDAFVVEAGTSLSASSGSAAPPMSGLPLDVPNVSTLTRDALANIDLSSTLLGISAGKSEYLRVFCMNPV